ncbi:MAG: glycoside hydrolase family 3 N-terminal domain-containing protein [Ornithinibacter sp.]
MSPTVARRTAHMIGNAHIDPVWTWCAPEGRAEVRATFASALQRLAEYPEFVFTQNQVVFLDWVADTDPALHAEIAEHVATGRWQLAGGWWVEPDTNLPLGESLARQALHGQRYLARAFGVRTDIGLCQDSFGHPASLPQLLAGAGLTRYAFLRPGPHEQQLPAGPFRWVGPDGAAVTAFRIPNEYGTSRWDIAGHIDKSLGLLSADGDVAIFYGVGNHGGGPTRENLDTLRRLHHFTDLPQLRPSTLGAFFAAHEGAALPEVTGDLHRHSVGCYSAHQDMKRWMRRAERSLLRAERWATVATGVTGLSYPRAALADAWKVTLFNQFHDTLAGTAIPAAYDDARDQLGYAATVADRATDRALQAIAARVELPFQPDTQCYLVFNPHPADTSTTVEIPHAHGEPGPLQVEDAGTGAVLVSQAVPGETTMGGWARRLLVRVDVHGLGYRALRLRPAPGGTGRAAAERSLRDDEPAVLDNGLVRLELDRATGRPVLLCAAGGPNLLGDGAHAMALADDSDTWGHRVRQFAGEAHHFTAAAPTVLEDGPVRRALRVVSTLGPNRLVEDYLLAAGDPFVEVRARLSWAAPHTVAKLRFRTAIVGAEGSGPVVRWEVPYGSTTRAADGSEEPLHSWLAVSGLVDGIPAGLGVAVDGLSAGDADIRSGTIDPAPAADVGLTMARSPLYAWHDPAPAATDPELPHLDIGTHRFRVRLVPFTPDPGRPASPAVTEAAATLVDPVTVAREGAHPGTLPGNATFACITDGTAALTVLKAPEDAAVAATVVRVVETSGAQTSAGIRLGGRTLRRELRAHQLLTLLVPHDPSAAPTEVDLCEWSDADRPPVQPLPDLPWAGAAYPINGSASTGHSSNGASSKGSSSNGGASNGGASKGGASNGGASNGSFVRTRSTRPWLDPAAVPTARAAALLATMTTPEKVAQLVGVWVNERDEHQAAFADGSFLDALRTDHPHGFGSLTRPYGSGPTPPAQAAEQVGAVQRFLVEGTRLGIPALVHEECLTGLMAPGASILPSALAWGATFSPEHVRAAAAEVGQQMRGLGIHLGLAPVLDVARDHRFGRVEECIGEDPLLVATLGAAYVTGLQSAGVGACAKHFVGHAAPEGGHNTAPVHAGWRELTDTHLPPFAAAVTAGVAAVMSGYHDIDGDPVTGSSALLDGLLRRRLHFDGPVVSDYWALNFLVTAHHVAADREQSATLALAAGVDLELPRPDHFPALVAAVDAGRVPVALLDAAVTRVLTLKFRLGLFEHPYGPDAHVPLDPPSARDAARALAERSVTLLRNDGVLPLRGVRRVAVVGPWVDDASVLAGNYSWPNHVGYRFDDDRFACGPLVPTFLDALRQVADRHGVEVTHVAACRPAGHLTTRSLADATFAAGPSAGYRDDPAGIAEAARAAREADVAIVLVGDRPGHFGTGTVGEGTDRHTLTLPGSQPDLVAAVLDTGTPTVAVVTAGRGLDLAVCEDASALLSVWFGGEAGADALARVVFGELNPSGRCPITFARGAGQQPVHHSSKPLARHHYLDETSRPRFAFGHGLGYSPFAYSDLTVSSPTLPVDGQVQLSLTVTNTGALDGEDVVQLYARDHVGQVSRPALELVGFTRVAVPAGGAVRVTFTVPAGAFAHAGRTERIVDPGRHTVWVGASCTDLRLATELVVVGPVRPLPLPRLEWVSACSVTLPAPDEATQATQATEASQATLSTQAPANPMATASPARAGLLLSAPASDGNNPAPAGSTS